MERFTCRKYYKRLYESKNKARSKYFLIIYILDANEDLSKAGITVSKKVGNAVVRNKVKRRIRAFLREYTFIEKDTCFLFNIIALPTCPSADWISIKKDLRLCIERMVTQTVT